MRFNDIQNRNRKTIEENNETKSWFLKKINKIDKYLTRTIEEQWKTQITKIRSERGMGHHY